MRNARKREKCDVRDMCENAKCKNVETPKRENRENREGRRTSTGPV